MPAEDGHRAAAAGVDAELRRSTRVHVGRIRRHAVIGHCVSRRDAYVADYAAHTKIVGLDIAKNVFAGAGIDDHGKSVFKRMLIATKYGMHAPTCR